MTSASDQFLRPLPYLLVPPCTRAALRDLKRVDALNKSWSQKGIRVFSSAQWWWLATFKAAQKARLSRLGRPGSLVRRGAGARTTSDRLCMGRGAASRPALWGNVTWSPLGIHRPAAG